jgi:hypothetical protein
MIAKMRAAGDDPTKNHTVWGWNYYYQQVTGVPTAPDPTQILPGNAAATTALINMDTWWAGMQSLGLSGLRSIQTFPVPALNTAGNMIYRAHHPLPYNPTYRLAGLGALTQPSGFERALWAGRSIRIGR